MDEVQKYVIVATVRSTGKRRAITSPSSHTKAFNWKPSNADKKLFKYFRVAKYPVNPQILK